MKKNTMMRIASILLIAVLVSTSAISGTYAKYVTSGTGTDTARVAKFGVEVTASGETFAKQYTDVAGDNGVQVVSSTEDKVVAPGTRGSLATVSVTGKPEVVTQITYDAELTLSGWEIPNTTEYCPIIFTINGDDYTIGDKTVADFADSVEAAIEAITNVYAANQDLSQVNDDLSVSWRWEFEENTLAGYQTDAKDTILGDEAAANNAATIKLIVTTTVTQVD